MNQLRLEFFGHARVTLPGETRPVRLGRAAASLLAYLLLHRHRLLSRDALCGVFWGDALEERARSCLSTGLWRLRQVLEPSGMARGTYLVTTADGEVGFNTESPYWLDVAAFEDVALRTTARPFHGAGVKDAAQLEAVLPLYVGELLEGHYEEWALAERERLHRLHVECLVWLMHFHGFYGEYDRAIAFGQAVVALDPAREEVHREVMRLYLESGQRSLAGRQFELCRVAVQRHLGTEPTPETRALYDGAVRGGSLRGDGAQGAVGSLVDRLEAAIRRFDDARDELRRAVDLVVRVAESSKKGEVSERRYSLSERSQVTAVRAP